MRSVHGPFLASLMQRSVHGPFLASLMQRSVHRFFRASLMQRSVHGPFHASLPFPQYVGEWEWKGGGDSGVRVCAGDKSGGAPLSPSRYKPGHAPSLPPSWVCGWVCRCVGVQGRWPSISHMAGPAGQLTGARACCGGQAGGRLWRLTPAEASARACLP